MIAYRHVIWDWNGTLLDDAWLCLQVINDLLTRDDLPPVTASRYSQVFGFPLEDYCRRLGFALDRKAYEELSDEFTQRYEARRMECSLRQGAVAALTRIQTLGATQSVLSAYSHHLLYEMIRLLGLTEQFEVVNGVDNPYGQGKIGLGVQHLEHLGHSPEEVLLVGDTLHDYQVAQAMEVDCVLVASGHQHPRRLATTGAPVVTTLDEVVALAVRRAPRTRQVAKL